MTPTLKVVWDKKAKALVDEPVKNEIEKLVEENQTQILKVWSCIQHCKDLPCYVSFHISTYGRKGDREGSFNVVCMFSEIWIAWESSLTKSRNANELLYQTVATVEILGDLRP